ncbi:MAG: hypothetical protein ACHQUC_01355 [Chlamydiales bacterium]
MKSIYKIKVLNWYEHNPDAKKSFKKTMVQHAIIHDAHINNMPTSHKWFFFSLLMICGDYACDTITLTERQVNDQLKTRVGAENALRLLQKNQLVTFEKIESFKGIEGIEYKGKEKKGITTEPGKSKNPEPEKQPSTLPEVFPSRPSKAVSRGCIDAFAENQICKLLLQNVSHKEQEAWLQAYPSPEWIAQEILKANTWIASNPNKAPKMFGRFMTSWLSRSFENFRKGLSSRRQTQSEVNAQSLQGLYEKVSSEEKK